MNGFELLETILLGINLYQAYKACSIGGRCGVAVAVVLLNVFVYVGSRVGVDRSVVALGVAFAVLVVLAVIGG
jgi:hypothetical protein